MKVLNEWFLDVPWGRIALISWGDLKGQPILLVHGRQDSSATFIPLLKLLPKHFYYVAFDLPGHGKSDPFPRGAALTRFIFVAPVEMVVKHLGWNEFYYISHSMGAGLGLLYNAIHPKRIAKLVLLDPKMAVRKLVVPNFVDFFSLYERYFENYAKLNTNTSVYSKQKAKESVMRARSMTEGQAEIILSRNLIKVGDDLYKLAWDNRLKALVPLLFPPDYYLKLFTMNPLPILCVHANQNPVDKDFKRNEIVEKLFDILEKQPHVKSLTVDGGHNVHVTHPELFSDVLCEFLNASDVISKL